MASLQNKTARLIDAVHGVGDGDGESIVESPTIPNVCDIVEYGLDSFGKQPATYRVDGWLCPRFPQPKITGHDMLLSGAMRRDLTCGEIAESVIHSILAERPASRVRLAWCTREEATHVALSGICGAIALVSECRVVGRVQWGEDAVADAVEYALLLSTSDRLVDTWISREEADMLVAPTKH